MEKERFNFYSANILFVGRSKGDGAIDREGKTGSYLRVKDLSDFVLLLVDIGGDFFGEKGRREDRAGRRRGKGVGLLLVLLLVLFFEGEVEAGGDDGRRAALELGEAHERRRRKRAMQ